MSYAPSAVQCNAVGVYYGSTQPARFTQARMCAFAWLGAFRDGTDQQKLEARRQVWKLNPDQQLEDDVDDAELTFLLAMLYNNGEGVTRNLDIARNFVCASSDWNEPAAIAASLKPGARLEECNKAGGSELGRRTNYVCLSIAQSQLSGKLKQALVHARASVAPSQQAGFDALVMAHDRFRSANGAEEPNGTSGAVQSGMFQELQLDRAWLKELKQIAGGRAPAASTPATELSAEDRALNEAYRANLKLARENGACDTCTTEEQYRASARAWLAYREAWVRFGTERWHAVTPDQWRAWLTAERNADQGGA